MIKGEPKEEKDATKVHIDVATGGSIQSFEDSGELFHQVFGDCSHLIKEITSSFDTNCQVQQIIEKLWAKFSESEKVNVKGILAAISLDAEVSKAPIAKNNPLPSTGLCNGLFSDKTKSDPALV